ncbi:hypothetical protein RI129_002553 [Pyrocoelia pectoralis]|uniref:Odorant receptor n=1 Tax=Pyrocoelia pectoralis TaxID=417401 RepID=A0AAN7ZTC5_9COLE
MMHASGFWPEENPTQFYKVRTFVSWLLSLALCVTLTMEVVNRITDFTKLSEILYTMVMVASYVIKATSLRYQRKNLLKIINFLKHPIFMSYPDELDHFMAKSVRQSTFIANAYRYSVGCCIILYLVYPIVDHKPYPFPFPFEMGSYNYYIFVFQVVGGACCAWNNLSIDTLMTSIMGITAAQLDILCGKLIGMGNKRNDSVSRRKTDEDMSRKLKQCVNHHNAVIWLNKSVEEVFTVGLLAQFTASIIGTCNTIFHFVLMPEITSQFVMLLNFFIVQMIQLFIYCWYGNEIILKSVQVGEACYKFTWYNNGSSVGKYIFLIMERSKRPLSITVVKLTTLSLATFLWVMRQSYSCLALLLKMYEKQVKEE